jgi:hypothetical protein
MTMRVNFVSMGMVVAVLCRAGPLLAATSLAYTKDSIGATQSTHSMKYAFGVGFRGGTLINGVVGAGCTRCDAPSIEAYLATLVD